MSAALLVAVLIASGIAEAQRGGGGGGFAKPPGNSKPSSEAKQSPSAKSGEKGAGSGVYSPGYGVRHGSLSNFFLWAWIFHDLGVFGGSGPETIRPTPASEAGRLWASARWAYGFWSGTSEDAWQDSAIERVRPGRLFAFASIW